MNGDALCMPLFTANTMETEDSVTDYAIESFPIGPRAAFHNKNVDSLTPTPVKTTDHRINYP